MMGISRNALRVVEKLKQETRSAVMDHCRGSGTCGIPELRAVLTHRRQRRPLGQLFRRVSSSSLSCDIYRASWEFDWEAVQGIVRGRSSRERGGDLVAAKSARFKVSPGRAACEVAIGHFIEFGNDGAKAQVLCAVQRQQGEAHMVVWLFMPLQGGHEDPAIEDSTGHEHLKRRSAEGRIALVAASSAQRRVHVLPFWA